MFTCSASPAGSWPSLLRALGNTPPLIKLMSVEIAIFNHFDVLGTKEMLFPPSGGLDSIKAAPSVKNNTLLGGCFFSPSPLKELLLQRGACKRRAVLQTAWHLLCSFCSAKCLHLKISSISCCLERVFLCWYLTAHPSTVQWQWQYWVCPCCYWGALPLLFAGTGEQCGYQTTFEQLLSLWLSISFALLTGFPICMGNLTEAFWVCRVLSTPNLPVTEEVDLSPFW